MENKQILKQIKLYASLLELLGESSFKIRSYNNAVFNLEKVDEPLHEMSLMELEALPGVGKAIAAKIDDSNKNGIFRQLQETLEEIPPGVVEMLSLDGLGAKKARTLWQELGIEDLDQLLQACENNRIAGVKGFGAKTQENIKQSILFKQASSDKIHYSQSEAYAEVVSKLLQAHQLDTQYTFLGAYARKLEVIEKLEVLIAHKEPELVFGVFQNWGAVEEKKPQASLFVWRGIFKEGGLGLEVRVCSAEQFASESFLGVASENHLGFFLEDKDKTLMEYARSQSYTDEAEIYSSLNWAYIPAELREGGKECTWAQEQKMPDLLEPGQVKGVLHAHSTYSDGKESLETMARACQEAGYEYLGITDHSRSAFYANGLYEHHVEKQHREIEEINQKMAPFKIFKGIESDILADGSLDYEPDVLESFDFIIASVHSSLKMNEAKATQRLVQAIANPYTTMLGHPTGRLLLRREGYPVHYPTILDACAEFKVSIEINANPWRLDLDWRWVQEALDRDIQLSINPDAHSLQGIQDVQYGVWMGRKGGLTAAHTLNCLGVAEIDAYFKKRKSERLAQRNPK